MSRPYKAPEFETEGARVKYLSRGAGESYPPNQRQDVMSAYESLGLKNKVVLGRGDYEKVGARSGNGWQFSRTIIRHWRAKNVVPEPAPRGGAHNVKLDDEALWYMDALTWRMPALQIEDYQQLSYNELGVYFSHGTVVGALQLLDLPLRKATNKVTLKYTDENLGKTVEYMETIKQVSPERLRFIDQMGVDRRNTGPLRIRVPRHMEPALAVPGPQGSHFTVTGMTCIRDDHPALLWDVIKGGSTKEYHGEWARQLLYGGHLSHGDVMVRDNCGIMGGDADIALQHEFMHYGITIVPLPPYTPEWNPIEMAWSSAKYRMRHFPRGYDGETLRALGASLDSLSHADMFKWYVGCGYIHGA